MIYIVKKKLLQGNVPIQKYSRATTETLGYTKHKFINGLHYHYQCVLKNLDDKTRNNLIRAEDRIALKTHYPYYAGIAELLNKSNK